MPAWATPLGAARWQACAAAMFPATLPSLVAPAAGRSHWGGWERQWVVAVSAKD